MLINPSKKNEVHIDISALRAQEIIELIQSGKAGTIRDKVVSMVDLRKYAPPKSTIIVKQSGRKA
jgi:hypothetical protein